MSNHSGSRKADGARLSLDSSKDHLAHSDYAVTTPTDGSNASFRSDDTVVRHDLKDTCEKSDDDLCDEPLPARTVADPQPTSKVMEVVTVAECTDDASNGLPPRTRAQLNRAQRFCLHWLTAYRVLIALAVTVNLAIFIAQIATGPSANTALTATAANLLAAVLVRNEEVVNTSYFILSKIPSTLPFKVRKLIGDFHHYGGAHIGCALSSTLWYCIFVALRTIEARDATRVSALLAVDVVLAWMFLLSVVTVCAMAIPRLRVRFHNSFERTHRFGGWTALLVLWVHTGMSTLSSPIGLWKQPALYMLAATTALIILPWTRIRHVPITAALISARDLKLTFAYTNMPSTTTMRFSTSPLMEWHAFATIPTSPNTACIIVSRAGDWTSALLANPPSHLYIRKPPTLNFLSLAPIFNSVLLVGTGAGIGPLLSLLGSPILASMIAAGKRVRVQWTVYEPHAPHWSFVIDAIQAVDPKPMLFNSKVGRPDVAFEAGECMAREGIEAVLVVSNPKVTRQVVDEVKQRGGAAYGAVFDS